jgi:hypothetical protein
MDVKQTPSQSERLSDYDSRSLERETSDMALRGHRKVCNQLLDCFFFRKMYIHVHKRKLTKEKDFSSLV